MSRTTQSSEAAAPQGCRSAALAAATNQNYTAQRVLRVLEAITPRPSSAPVVAAAIGVHPRTARRILRTLASEGYVERRGGEGGRACEYQPTVRIVALAAAIATRLPLIQSARGAVHELERETELTAYVAVPCYSDVLVIAASGARSLRPWAMLPARADAAGRMLLAVREAWRNSVQRADPELAMDDDEVANVLARGYVQRSNGGEGTGSLAVAVPAPGSPIAALGLRGPAASLTVDQRALLMRLHRCAAQIATANRSSGGDPQLRRQGPR